jgi:chromate reductase
VDNDQRPVRILAISGSLRSASSNSALVEAAAGLAIKTAEVSVYRDLAQLPPFNPDLDGESPAAPVAQFRSALRACDAVLISSPEYAHGVPGVLKNALDWIVGSGELIDKPVALLNTSAYAIHAQASLAETLTVMSARLVPEASITIPLASRKLEAKGILADHAFATALRSAVHSLALAVRVLTVSIG